MGDDIPEESFTEQEKTLISPYFTNLDKPVFALINLPEVVKGALFSRYSRSSKSLRRVLLDEFILKPEMGFKEIVAHHPIDEKSQIVATKKAEEFYERVLVGYGDDSVAELGGASIACEQVSQIAAKFIESSRIGLSPLEKSTRYVWFNRKNKNRYSYYKEPVLMDSEFADIYTETCELLFDTYSELVEPMTRFFTEKFSREDGISERAYNSAIRAKACDVLRSFLPAATLTNIGIYGNGRAYEYLLTKMLANNISELRNLAGSIHTELSVVIPSFVKRCNDIYGKSTQEYLSESLNGITDFAKENVFTKDKFDSGRVTLVDYDREAELKVLSAMVYPNTNMQLTQLREVVKNLSPEKKAELASQYSMRRKNRRHKPGRALENSYYWFDILTNYGAYRDLQRHRMLTQEAQRLTVKNGYDTSKELEDAGFADKYHECMRVVKDTYNKIYAKYPKEAQYVVAFGYRIRWYVCLNLRELCHLTELRSMQQGHPDYRHIAQEMYLKVKEVHPIISENIKFVDMSDYGLERISAEVKTDKKLAEIKQRYIVDV